MAFERLKTEISMLLSEMENQPQDQWEMHELVLEKLNELRAFDLPLPQDLLDLEKRISKDLEDAGQIHTMPSSRPSSSSKSDE
ncbi:MAG: hypothetical protein COB78_00980 [Hyphomicrobiales bacterium]|nr:MAG: hypothetical protein COB78_00980 [Hyphomicrobiales bacterium]